MVEFVAKNSSIFEELDRFIKSKRKDKAKSLKRHSVTSPEIPFEEESDDQHPR